MTTTKKQKSAGRPRQFDREIAIEKAMDAFCDFGYDATSISRLCQYMGINSPSLYATFGSKEQLFIEALEFYHVPYLKEVNEVLNKGGNTLDSLKAFFDFLEKRHIEQKPMGHLVVNSALINPDEHPNIGEKVRKIHQENETIIYKFLERGQLRGDFLHSIDIKAISHFINGLVHGVTTMSSAKQPAEIIRDTLHLGYEALKLMLKSPR